jgi:hypothetical protein
MKCPDRRECSVCAHRRWDVQMCKYEVCTYQMCRRCIFLYGRNKLCPACRRPNAFKLTRRWYKCDNVLYYPHVECVCTYVFFPILFVFGISVVGNMLLYTFDPYCCKHRNFVEFILQGIFIMVPIICFSICICACCKENNE